MKTTISINPLILRWARETSNLSDKEAAHKLGINIEKFKLFESGEEKPTYNQLENISTVFKRPVALFFFPAPPEEKEIKTSFRTYPIEDVISLAPNIIFLIRQAQANILNLCEIFDGINPSKSKLDNLFSSFTIFDKNSANIIRSYFNVSISTQKEWYRKYRSDSYEIALKLWRDAIEDFGIFIFKAPFKDDRISGFCVYDNEFPVIYINNQLSFSRQIFTLFHELYHILCKINSIDKYGEDYINNLVNDDKQIEIYCHNFAASFLVPENDLRRQLDFLTPSENNIIGLSYLYSVSREVILRRLRTINLIETDKYNELMKKWMTENYRKKSKSKGGDHINNMLSYLSKNYIIAVYKKYYSNRIDKFQLSNYIKIGTAYLSEFENKLRQML